MKFVFPGTYSVARTMCLDRTKVYDAYFKKRLAWCTERVCNHITGLISDVANSLADLDSQGYQTSSLDAYWSTVSSVHNRVDDIDLGSIH